jgi:hypothetical protein
LKKELAAHKASIKTWLENVKVHSHLLPSLLLFHSSFTFFHFFSLFFCFFSLVIRFFSLVIRFFYIYIFIYLCYFSLFALVSLGCSFPYLFDWCIILIRFILFYFDFKLILKPNSSLRAMSCKTRGMGSLPRQFTLPLEYPPLPEIQPPRGDVKRLAYPLSPPLLSSLSLSPSLHSLVSPNVIYLIFATSSSKTKN